MRCLSPHRNYSIQVIEGNEQVVVDARGHATTVQISKPVVADFDQSGLLDYEELAAFEHFTFSGLAEGVNPLTTLSVFDTEAYCQRFPKDRRDELNVQIDKRMRELQSIFPSEFIIVETPQAAKPWPRYDEYTVEDILKFQEALGVNPDEIRLYELENENRDELVIALLQLNDPAAADRYAKKIAGVDVDDEEESGVGGALPGLSDPSKLRELLGDEAKPETPGRVIVDA
jgi:hypothetical protein